MRWTEPHDIHSLIHTARTAGRDQTTNDTLGEGGKSGGRAWCVRRVER